MNEIISLPASQDNMLVNLTNAKTGAVSTRPMNKQEYKAWYEKQEANKGHSAKQLKKAFETYTREKQIEMGKGFNFQKAIALADAGKLGIRRVAASKDGKATTVVFLDMSESEADSAKHVVDTMTADEIAAFKAWLLEKREQLDHTANHVGEQ